MDGRKTALDVLISCRKQGAWANGALKEYILRDRLDRRDAALAARLCYGVLQNRYLLDFTLQQLLTGKVKDLHPVVRDILHLGLYQICFLDKIPASAAVNEAVAQAKKYCPGQRWASGLVNAVLRSFLRGNKHVSLPSDPWENASVVGSMPKELMSIFDESYPPLLRECADAPLILYIRSQRQRKRNL